MRQGRRAFVGALAVLASAPAGAQCAPMFATRPLRALPFMAAGVTAD